MAQKHRMLLQKQLNVTASQAGAAARRPRPSGFSALSWPESERGSRGCGV